MVIVFQNMFGFVTSDMLIFVMIDDACQFTIGPCFVYIVNSFYHANHTILSCFPMYIGQLI